MTPNHTPKLPDPSRLDEDAAYWAERLRRGGEDAATLRAFNAWLEACPDHRSAFERAERAWSVVRSVAEAPEFLAERNATLARTSDRLETRQTFGAVATIAASVAATLALLTGFGLMYYSGAGDGEHALVASAAPGNYETNIGERLSATLDDGTVLTLDTQSRVRVAYSKDERAVELIAGRASFDVTPDVERPFVVTANGRRVTALGTSFDVRVTAGEFEVMLVKGRVRIDPAPDEGDAAAGAVEAPIELTPGQRLIASASVEPVVEAADVERETSWRVGLLIFEDDTLSHAISEMNRYSKRKIRLASDDLGELRVSGAFEAGRSDVFVEAIAQYFALEIVHEDAEAVELSGRDET